MAAKTNNLFWKGGGGGGSDGHVKRDFIYCNCEKKDGFIEAFNGKLFVFLPFRV